MTQYINKSILIEEIKKRISLFKKEKKTEKWSAGASQMNVVSLGARIAMLEEILSFLDTLEVKDVDLVEEFADFLEKENAYVDDNNVISYYNGSSFNHTCDIYPIAKHFFELGLKAQKGE